MAIFKKKGLRISLLEPSIAINSIVNSNCKYKKFENIQFPLIFRLRYTHFSPHPPMSLRPQSSSPSFTLLPCEAVSSRLPSLVHSKHIRGRSTRTTEQERSRRKPGAEVGKGRESLGDFPLLREYDLLALWGIILELEFRREKVKREEIREQIRKESTVPKIISEWLMKWFLI